MADSVALRSIADYINLPTTGPSWLIEPLIPVGGMACLYAAPKTGKSSMAIQLGQAIASEGEPDVLGFRIRQRGAVLYLQLDTPRSLWQGRFLRLQSQGIDFSPRFAAYDREEVDIPFPFDILSATQGASWLANLCRRGNPVLVIVDTLIETHQLDENKTQEMKLVINALQHCVAPAALLIVTHAKKENPLFEASVIAGLRGNSAISGKMDTILQLNKTCLKIEGRAMEDTTLALHQDPDTHLWHLDGQASTRRSSASVDHRTAHQLNHQAAQLASASGLSLPAATARLRKARSA